MTTFNERAEKLLTDVWMDIQKASQQRELAQIKANPEKHRLTRIMATGKHTGYTYFRAEATKTTRTLYCVSKHRNAAGVFLIWKQIDRYRGSGRKRAWHETERIDFRWAPHKREAFEIARKLADKSKLDNARKLAAKLPHAPAEAYAMLAQAIG